MLIATLLPTAAAAGVRADAHKTHHGHCDH
jgi:hypothetical protein